MRTLSLISVVTTLLRSVVTEHIVVELLHEVPQGWVKTREADPSQQIRLRIALEQPNLSLFEQKLYDVSTPQHSFYGQHLSRQELKDLMRPRSESTSAVLDWLQTSGVTETDIEDAGEWINFRTNVSMADELLGTEFGIYKNLDTNIERLRTLQYRVPEEVRPHITLVQPTTRFGQMRPQRSLIVEVLDKEDIDDNDVEFLSAAAVPPPGLDEDACNQIITPECLRALYKMGNATADPSTKAIFGIAGFLEQYAKYTGLELFLERFAPYAQSQNFTAVSVNGGKNVQDDFALDDTEANLDIQYAAAMGFETDLRYYSTGGRGPLVPDLDQPNPNDPSNEPYLELLTYLLDLPDDELPHTLSVSYGENEQSVPKTYAEKVCTMFGQLGARGTSVIFASGDTGPGSGCLTNDGTNVTRLMPTFPAACPYVTSVGGTKNVSPEQAVWFSSGGFSDLFEQPPYQKAAVSTYLTEHLAPATLQGLYNPAGRGFPDLAAQATRYSVLGAHGNLQLVGGTSAAAPMVAGIVSLLNSARLAAGGRGLGFLNPWLYADAAAADAFTDIVDGGSKGCTGRDLFTGQPAPYIPGAGWNATPGWDPVTGLGTPLFDRLLAAATAAAPNTTATTTITPAAHFLPRVPRRFETRRGT